MSIFASLHPLLEHGPLNLTVASEGDGKIRVCILPTKLATSEKHGAPAPTFPPMSFVGTVKELDDELPAALTAGVVTPALSLHAQAAKLLNDFEETEKANAAAAKAAADAKKKSSTVKPADKKPEPKPAPEPDLFSQATASATPPPASTPAAPAAESGDDDETGDGDAAGATN